VPESASADLESKLAGFVRSYIRASRREDSSQESEALRWLCCGLEYLLGELLQHSDEWKGWVDGVTPATYMIPDSIKIVSPVNATLRGYADWAMDARGPFWIEPFLADVHISETEDVVVSYELNFADATRGLGRVPYGKHIRRPDWFFPTDWLFTFSKAAQHY
jgi:hypothetical protein